MVANNKYLGQVFPSPTLTGYRRQPNIRSFIVRASIAKPKERYPGRKTNGMKRCNQTDCTSCPYIQEGNKITINGTPWSITNKVNCLSYNIGYGIICKKDRCGQVYIGETKIMLKFRLSDHRLADLSITVIEQVKKNDLIYRN